MQPVNQGLKGAPAPGGSNPPPLFPGRKMLYVREVAEHLRITRQHVVDLIEEGNLAAVNVNSEAEKRACWRIPVEAYEAFLRRRRV